MYETFETRVGGSYITFVVHVLKAIKPERQRARPMGYVAAFPRCEVTDDGSVEVCEVWIVDRDTFLQIVLGAEIPVVS